jgi:hypothetical protein
MHGSIYGRSSSTKAVHMQYTAHHGGTRQYKMDYCVLHVRQYTSVVAVHADCKEYEAVLGGCSMQCRWSLGAGEQYNSK